MQNKQYLSLCFVALVLGQAFALPQQIVQPDQIEGGRKFAEKPNATKKVALDDLEDVSTNSIQETIGSFSWSNMLGMIMQMLLGQTPNITSPSKNDVDETVNQNPWANFLQMSLKVLTMFFGGNQQQLDGIDKVDNQANTPMQGILTTVLGAFLGGQGRNPDQVAVIASQATEFFGIIFNLLEVLKQSFSHRSFQARSLGKKDTISEAAVASISMLKGYVRSMKSFGNVGRAEEEGQRGCAERALCEASAECAADTHGSNTIFCQLGSYATSYLLQRQSGVSVEALFEAGRRGRSGDDCRTLFLDCNAI